MRHAVFAVAVLMLPLHAAPAAAQAKVIELTQVPCQFIESEEGRDRGFKSAKFADCEAINTKTGAQRLAEAKTFELTPGKTRDYEIELKPGNYVYSCPLNPTPDYRLIVK